MHRGQKALGARRGAHKTADVGAGKRLLGEDGKAAPAPTRAIRRGGSGGDQVPAVAPCKERQAGRAGLRNVRFLQAEHRGLLLLSELQHVRDVDPPTIDVARA
eukprot:12113916-Alexandrium_andersonii.AAC.1